MISAFCAPVLMLVGTFLWFWRARGWASAVGFVGVLISVGSIITSALGSAHLIEIGIADGRATPGENAFVFFLYAHGHYLGSLLTAGALCWHFVFEHRAQQRASPEGTPPSTPVGP